MMDIDDIIPWILGVILVVLCLALAGLLVFGGIEGVQSLRARNAVFACERANLRAVRKALSADVACVSRTLGADTLNVRQVRP